MNLTLVCVAILAGEETLDGSRILLSLSPQVRAHRSTLPCPAFSHGFQE